MTLREWLDSYTANGDAQLVCAWRKRAWRAMRPVVEQIESDIPAWTVGKALKAIDAAAYAANIKTGGKRWKQEYEKLTAILNATPGLWRVPTHDEIGVCLVAADLVEQEQYAEAAALIIEQAPNVYERTCPACSSPASWCCEEISGDDMPPVDTPQTAAARAAGLKVWSRRSRIVPHEARFA